MLAMQRTGLLRRPSADELRFLLMRFLLHQRRLESRSTHYRAEIDGLRAFAILAVVLFHYGIQGAGGGFVGVDIFFVISGFLITQIIQREISEGRFSVLHFYERRIRRIFPALFLVLSVTWIGCFIVLYSADLQGVSTTLAAAAAFLSNFQLIRGANIYFDDTFNNPAGHTWTLSVEEQFYLLYPALLVSIQKFLGGRVLLALATLGGVSLCLSVLFSYSAPVWSFFGPQTRFWEFAVGGLVAVAPLPEWHRVRLFREVVAMTGLLLMVAAVFFFSGNTVFPGYAATVPCVGAAMVLFSSRGGSSQASRLLSWAPLVWLGLISYSIYLWHWPLLILAKHFVQPEELSWLNKAALIAITVAISAISTRFVEWPFRSGKLVKGRKKVFLVALSLVAVFVAIGLTVRLEKGFPARDLRAFDPVVSSDLRESAHRFEVCFFDAPDTSNSKAVCETGPSTKADFYVWGDSHGLAISPAIFRAAQIKHWSGKYLGMPGCPPLLDIELKTRAFSRTSCDAANRAILDTIRQSRPRVVFLAAAWSLYTEGKLEASNVRVFLTDSHSRMASQEENRAAFARAMKRTMASLAGSGVKVVLLEDVPAFAWKPPEVFANSRRWGREIPEGQSTASHFIRQKHANAVFDQLQKDFKFDRVNPAEVLCDSKVCKADRNGRLLYLDDNHLTIYGAVSLSALFVPYFQ